MCNRVRQQWKGVRTRVVARTTWRGRVGEKETFLNLESLVERWV